MLSQPAREKTGKPVSVARLSGSSTWMTMAAMATASRTTIITPWTWSVRRLAGSPPHAVYAAVTPPTATIDTHGSMPPRASSTPPMAVSSAVMNMNM
jgi:hypothetical protein